MLKIDDLKVPPTIGEYYLVPCVISEFNVFDKEWFEVDGDMCLDWDYDNPIKKHYVYPIINNLHSDIESGQNYKHYHVDYRFVVLNEFGMPKNMDKRYDFAPYPRFNLIEPDSILHRNSGYNKNPKVEYHRLKCIRTENKGIAGAFHMANIKHKCLKNGKCPHRGGDLSQSVPDENGIITCPLHGAKFHSSTGDMIEEHKKLITDYKNKQK